MSKIASNGYELGHSCAPADEYPRATEIVMDALSAVELLNWARCFDFPTTRDEQIERVIEYRAALAWDIEHYENLRIHGADVLSYHFGDKQSALNCAMATAYSHIHAHLRLIAAARLMAPTVVEYVEALRTTDIMKPVGAPDQNEEEEQLALF